MSHEELELIIGKARKLKELRRAKEHVKRLERELRGEPVQPEDAPHVPEFLRAQVDTRWADRAANRPPPLPRRSRVIENLHGHGRHRVGLPHEPAP